MPTITEDHVKSLVDPTVIQEVQSVGPMEGNEFNLALYVSGRPIHAIKPQDQDHLRIITNLELGPASLALIISQERARRDLMIQLASVLTNTRGMFTYLDENEDSCEFEDMEALRLEDHLYSNALNSQLFMDSVMSLASAQVYIIHAVNTMLENLDSDT